MVFRSQSSLPSIAIDTSNPKRLSPCSAMLRQSTVHVSGPTSMRLLIRIRCGVLDPDRVSRGILDTSVLIDLEKIDPTLLPAEVAISSITLAELSAGPHATDDPDERSRRLDRLQRAEAAFDPLPFDIEAARAYGRVFAVAMSAGRKARGQRAVDLLIAAAAVSAGLPVFTRNEADFAAVSDLVDIVVV